MRAPPTGLAFSEPRRPGRSALLSGGYIRDKHECVQGRRYGAYALVYLIAGGGFYEDERHGRRSVARGDVLVLFPDLRHGYGPSQPGEWSEIWLGCAGPLFVQLEREGVLDRERPVLSPGLDPLLVEHFDVLVRGIAAPATDDSDLLTARLHVLMAELADRHRRGQRSPRDQTLVDAACAALAERLHEPIDLQAVARRLGISFDRLRRTFTRHTGVSPTRWRLLRRIELAKSRLAAGATLAETAQALGYCDQFFFARQFKAVTGQTPGAWRRGFLG